MKVTLVLVAVLAIFQPSLSIPASRQVRIFEDSIIAIVGKVSKILARFDPHHKDLIEGSLLGHNGKIENLHLEGFSNFGFSELKIDGLFNIDIVFAFNVPHKKYSVDSWSVEGWLFYGAGIASYEVNDIAVTADIKIDVLGLDVTNFHVKTSGTGQVALTGVFNDEALSQRITDKANALLTDVLNNEVFSIEEVVQAVIDAIKNLIDNIFN